MLLLPTRNMYNCVRVGYSDTLTTHYANIYRIRAVYSAFMHRRAFFVEQYIEVNGFVCSCCCT